MAAMSDYLEKALLDHVLGGAEYASPDNIFVALFTTAPSDSGGGTEVSGSGYSREVVEFSPAHATNGTASSSDSVSFTASGGAWGTVTHVALFDAVTDGNMLFHGAIDTPRTVNDGQTLVFDVAEITVILS